MKYKVKEPFKALCCGNYFEIGQILEPYDHPSKNRLYVNAYEIIKGEQRVGGSHNVKRSTFFRCCEAINENLYTP